MTRLRSQQKILTKITAYRYLSSMEIFAILCIVLVVGHVASMFFVMRGVTGLSMEFRKVVLEREETQRQLWASGAELTSDDQDSNARLEVV